ncbi:hypothetical protein [Rhizobium phage RHph_X2_26]|nr:hypothetical protein [Rhizobium phage RHph_X2_26]
MIAIDWEVHQLIELERRGFDEQPVSALRRLLGLDKEGARVTVRVPAGHGETAAVAAAAAPVQPVEAANHNADPNAPWTAEGVTIPSGTPARMIYRKGTRPIPGEFKGGKLIATGKEYATLSEAANDLASTRVGHKTRLNGWLYWAVKFPGSDTWVTLDALRKAAKPGAVAKRGRGKRK